MPRRGGRSRRPPRRRRRHKRAGVARPPMRSSPWVPPAFGLRSRSPWWRFRERWLVAPTV
ncbi:hypothetical protein [Azospirillum argentinense]